MPRRPLWIFPGALLALVVLACRPDPHQLLLRTIEPGEEVALPGGMLLVAGARDGAVLHDVRITGPARTCDGTMTLDAREVRIERIDGASQLIVLDAVAEELCGPLTSTTTNERLTIRLGE